MSEKKKNSDRKKKKEINYNKQFPPQLVFQFRISIYTYICLIVESVRRVIYYSLTPYRKMIIMDQSVEQIFNLSLSEIAITCPPEISNYFTGAALTRLNQIRLFGEDDATFLTRQQLNATDHFPVSDSSSVSDWSSTVLAGSVSSVPTPAGILRNHQHSLNVARQQEDMQRLKYYSYGIALPAICIMGILGNVLNLIVLTRPTMRGPAYVYMRGDLKK